MAQTRCGSKKLWLNKLALLNHHERARIPYPDITGMYLAPDIKISGHIHGRPKCQISLKLACFLSLSPPHQISTLRDAAWYEIYSHLWSIMSNTMRCSVWPACGVSYGCIRSLLLWCNGRPVGAHMVTYGLFLYGTARPGSSRGTDKPPSLLPRLLLHRL